MTAKEKANELYSKFLNKIDHLDAYWDIEKDAKECALICVDEILKITWVDSILTVEDFWQEVKEEIELL